MHFRLYYRGDLKANGDSKHKNELRKQFHPQLKQLWTQEPVKGISDYIDPDYEPNDCYLGEERNGYTFFPIISEKLFTVAELDILMLRPGDPGSITVGGGDIDNRIKTLLDSLTVPVGAYKSNLITDDYIYCLLQDDKLITRLNIKTDRLLDFDGKNNNEVILIIHVHVMASSGRMCNLSICV